MCKPQVRRWWVAGDVLEVELIDSESPDGLREFLRRLQTEYGMAVLVSDDQESYKQLADELGLAHSWLTWKRCNYSSLCAHRMAPTAWLLTCAATKQRCHRPKVQKRPSSIVFAWSHAHFQAPCFRPQPRPPHPLLSRPP